MVALLYGPITLLLLILGVVALLFRKRKISAVCLVVALICNYYWEVYAVNYISCEDNDVFKVVTYNIYANTDSNKYDEWEDEMIKEIDNINPDILSLQEFDFERFRSLEQSINKHFSYSNDYIDTLYAQRWVLYSKFPVRNPAVYFARSAVDTTGLSDSQKMQVSNIQSKLCFSSIETMVAPNKWVSVFTCHLRSNAYSTIRRSMPLGSTWFSGLSQYYEGIKLGERIRLWEASEMISHINNIDKKNPIIIAGDFNDVSSSQVLKMFQKEGFIDSWTVSGNGFGFTYFGWHLMLKLDHVLYRGDIRPVRSEILSSELSDHRPLCVYFKIQ